MTGTVNIGNGVVVDKDVAMALDMAGAAWFDHHDDVARSMISDPKQLEYFERWLKRGGPPSPDPKDESLRQAYDAIVYLAMNGCG